MMDAMSLMENNISNSLVHIGMALNQISMN